MKRSQRLPLFAGLLDLGQLVPVETSARQGRSGGALLFAVVLVTIVAGISVLMMRLSTGLNKRTRVNVDDKRAFYLAEAGLSEAYYGIRGGNTGQVGSIEAPALAGNGLVWVDRIDREDGSIRLESTGLCGIGRATLAITVEPKEEALGIFSDDPIKIDTPLMLDGYDSEESSYYEQALPSVAPNPGDYVHDNLSVSVVRIAEMYYDYVYKEGKQFYFIDSVARDPIVRTIDARVYFDAKQAAEPEELSPTTGGGGLLASNGDISLEALAAGGVTIYGDVRPGPGGEVLTEPDVHITGATEPSQTPVVLTPVEVPDVELLAGVDHSSALPFTVPASTVGYQSFVIRAGSELILNGPLELVVGELTLEDGSALSIENEDGAVNLYITERGVFAPGSTVRTSSLSSGNLALLFTGTEEVELSADSQFHGVVYAPTALVSVSDTFEIYGALIGQGLSLAPGTRIHFDSGYLANSAIPRVLSWKITELPERIRGHRADAFDLLSVKPEDLVPITEAQESREWMVEIEYPAWSGKGTYEGPLAEWLALGFHEYTTSTMIPPSAELGGEWTMYIKYKRGGGPQEYTGPVADFDLSGLVWIYHSVLTPPAGYKP